MCIFSVIEKPFIVNISFKVNQQSLLDNTNLLQWERKEQSAVCYARDTNNFNYELR